MSLIAGFILIIIYVSLSLGILQIAALWQIFEKADYPGWAAVIPFYNVLVGLRIIGKPWYWLLLLCIPVLNVVLAIHGLGLLSKSFGKDGRFTSGLVFLSVVYLPMLGFGNSTYLGPYGNPALFRIYMGSRNEGFDFEQNAIL